MNHKKRRPARSRGAAKLCWCNPHQQALGNTRKGYATREQLRSALAIKEALHDRPN